MSLIYIAKTNFQLNKNPHFNDLLEVNKISKKDYKTDIQPFLESLSGFYFAKGPQLTRNLIPQLTFELNGASLSKIFEYQNNEDVTIDIPIQDKISLYNERVFSMTRPVNPDYEPLIKRGMSTINYKKQVGKITFTKQDYIETVKATLDQIVSKELWIETYQLSDYAIRRVLD